MATQHYPVVWFEIPVNDLPRAQAFYEQVFGRDLQLQEMGPLQMAFFPMQEDDSGAGGALVKAEGYVPSQTGTVVYFSVADINETLERVKAGGGKVLSPKTSIGEYGFIAHCQDTEGNRIALHSM